MENDSENELLGAYKTVLLIYVAFVAAIFFCGLPVFYIGINPGDTDVIEHREILKWVLLAISVSALATSEFSKKSKDKRSGLRFSTGVPHSPVVEALIRSSLIAFALSELPAILGLVYSILTDGYKLYPVFGALSLAGFIRHFPRYSKWEEYVSEHYRNEE